jgi:ribonuclease J
VGTGFRKRSCTNEKLKRDDDFNKTSSRFHAGSRVMANPGDELVFAPLGGVGEIGMNLSIYGFGPERRRTWLAVDLGVAFGSEELLPGVDLIMPDVRFLAEERQNLVGIVLTHAHEDHFGALIDLWPRLRVPVYATPFTAALFEAKRLGEPGAPEIPIKVVPLGARFSLGPFDIELVSVAHSIPESNALIIRTPLGTVLHTGDWKLDPTPVLGAPTDEPKLKALGEEGVLALIGDSTNAVREGRSPSEADVAKVLADLVRAAPGRVAVTTFASNVARIRSAALAGFAAGREIVVIGRAMERVIQVARETGYLDGVGDFRGTDVYGYLPPEKVLALCTGSQGEPRAALARIALDEHPDVSLAKGDRVIFSSRTIPGNEKAVGRIVNGLVRQGVEVISDRTHLVHVSGHPRRAELADMFSWVKPRIAIPVHGEALHLAEHAALARSVGVPATIICQNGDLIKLAPAPAGIIDEVPAARLYKDGKLVVEAEGRTVPLRRRLAYNGMVTVALALTEKGELAADPEVELIGIPELDAAGESMAEVAYDAVKATLESLPRARRRDPDETAESIRRAVRSAIAERWGKKPVCHVHVLGV